MGFGSFDLGNTFRKGSGEGRQAQQISTVMSDQVAREQQDIANMNWQFAKPVTQQTAGLFNNFLTTGVTPSFLDLPSQVTPTANLQIPGLEQSQNLLRRQLVNQGSRGGLLQQQLAQAAIGTGLERANLQIGDLLRQEQRDVQRAELRQRLFGAASDFGTGGTALSLQGLAGAGGTLGASGGILSQLSGQRINQNMAKTGKTGQGAGALAGAAAAAMFMCWIAMELYGPMSWKTWRIRFYLQERAEKNLLASLGVWLYRRYGQLAARLVARYRPIRRLAHWYFDKLLVRAALR